MCFPLDGFWQKEINDGIRGDGKARVTEGFRCSTEKKKKKEKSCRSDSMIICTCWIDFLLLC